MRWLLLFLPALAFAASPDFRLERTPVSGGAELLTIFATVPARPDPVPLVTVLHDTLGDAEPSNDRLRYIWTLTSASPSVFQRAAGAIPFFYWRPNLGKKASKNPKPVIDLGNSRGIVWNSIAQQLAQIAAMDPEGALVRASTRRYRNNLADRRRVHLMGGLAVVSQLETLPGVRDILTEEELFEIQARMTLAGQSLGGLVTADKLPDAYFKQREKTQETRGHNWELLRQRAEANGLYFDPLGIGETPTHAILWAARQDASRENPAFDGKFLNIASPYGDARVKDWTGISVTRFFDPTGRQVPEGTPGATPRELIPLALYGLDYPKVPLLLIDFRSTHSPKRREMLARATSDLLMGVIGYSRWGNWPYMAGSFVWNFTRTRRGSATNMQARLNSYSTVRRWVALDHEIPEPLREDLQKRLDVLGVNPLEESVQDEFRVADRQFAALVTSSTDPAGLPARLNKARAAELVAYEHGPRARTGFKLARIVTLGIYKHREREQGDALLAALDWSRRGEREMRYLTTLAKSGLDPGPADMVNVTRAVNTLSSIRIPARSAKEVAALIERFHAPGN